MRSVLIDHILPLGIAAGILIIVFICLENPESVSRIETEIPSNVHPGRPANYIPSLGNSPDNEAMLSSALSSGTLIVLGSSELSETTSAIPYRFFTDSPGFPVLGVGHAGYQSLAMLATLGCMARELHDTRVLVIVSPGWFEDIPSGGTSVDLFLENMSDRMLDTMILSGALPFTYRSYIARYIANNYNLINRASAPYRYLYHLGASEKSIFSRILHYPFLKWNQWLFSHPFEFTGKKDHRDSANMKRSPLIAFDNEHGMETGTVSWDSLLNEAQALAAKRATNNSWGISDEYYTTYIHGNRGRIKPVSHGHNQELHDFGKLVGLLKEFDCQASFVIQPLNPYYFPELHLLEPAIQAVTDTIARAEFPCLNLFESDTARYRKAMLRDVMHMDDYAWYLMNRFIENQYIRNE